MVWYTYLNDFDINFWVMYKNNKTNTKSALLLKLTFAKTQLLNIIYSQTKYWHKQNLQLKVIY